MSERIVRPLDRARLAVLVRGCREVTFPLPPGRGHRIDVIAERGCGDDWEVCCVPGPVSYGLPLMTVVPDAWTPLARVHVAAGMCAVQECNITIGRAAPPYWRPGPPCCPASNLTPVESVVGGRLLAWLCLGCDRQLPHG